jgi:ABC-type polysaccharide/polyol phosphate transport system ATPase subunit
MRAGIEIDALWQAYRPRTGRGLRGRKSAVHWALVDVSLSVAAGEMVGVIGSNGSGKTTLLRTVSGVLRPTRGTVRTAGAVASLIDLNVGVQRDLTGYETLLVHGVLLGMTRRQVRERTDAIAAFAQLNHEELCRPLSTYSTGMTLRLGFALVVHLDPSVLVVDEVVSAGDEGFQRKCMAAIHDLTARGCAVLMVSHDMPLVRDHCDRAVVLERGRFMCEGAPEDAVDDHVERQLTSQRVPVGV